MNMVKTKTFARIFIFLIAVLSLILKAEGIGILSSGDMSMIDFQPNAKITLPFGVRSNMAVPMDVELSVSGDLSKYAELSEDNLFLNPQETKYFTVTVNFPAEIDVPGDHLLWVRALEEPSGGTISVRSAVNTWVKIRVPYPGKYVITSFNAPDVNVNEIVKFSVTVNNLGKEDIKKAKAKIDIFGPDEDNIDKYIDTVYTEEKAVPPKSTETLEASLDTAGYKPGEYRAVAAIFYDENQTSIEKYFKIGYLHVKIFNYTSEFRPNKIQKFDIGVESAWNNRIEDVYVEVRIMEDDNIGVTATTVRVPVYICHSEAVNVETEEKITANEARAIFSATPGIIVYDDPKKNIYPVPLEVSGKDEVYVGRIREDESIRNGLNLWVVADNPRKGAATNAVQIAELLIK